MNRVIAQCFYYPKENLLGVVETCFNKLAAIFCGVYEIAIYVVCFLRIGENSFVCRTNVSTFRVTTSKIKIILHVIHIYKAFFYKEVLLVFTLRRWLKKNQPRTYY